MRGSRRKGKSCNEASSGEDESEGSQDVTEENESKEERCAAEGPSEKDSNEKTKTISNIKKKASEVLEKWVPGKNKKEKGPDEGQVVGGSNESTKKAGSEVEGETTSGEEKPEGSEEQREGTSFQNGQGAEEGQHAQQSQQQWYPVPLCPTTFIHICCQHVPPGSLPQCQQSGQPDCRPPVACLPPGNGRPQQSAQQNTLQPVACFLPGYYPLQQNAPPNQGGNSSGENGKKLPRQPVPLQPGQGGTSSQRNALDGGNGTVPLQQIPQPVPGETSSQRNALDVPPVQHVVKKLPKLTQAERGRNFWKSCLAALCVCCTLEACGGGVRKNNDSE